MIRSIIVLSTYKISMSRHMVNVIFKRFRVGNQIIASFVAVFVIAVVVISVVVVVFVLVRVNALSLAPPKWADVSEEDVFHTP